MVKLNNTRGAVKAVLIVLSALALVSCAALGILTDAQSSFETGMAHFTRGEYEQAIPQFEKAIELDPEYGDAYLYLGRSLLTLRRYSQALTPLRTAFRLSPDTFRQSIVDLIIDALFGAAAGSLRTGNLSDSMGYVNEILQLHPRSGEVMDQLAAILVKLGEEFLGKGKLSDAITMFKTALTLKPGEVSIYLDLLKAFIRKGDIARALETAEKALSMDPQNRDLQLLLRQFLGR